MRRTLFTGAAAACTLAVAAAVAADEKREAPEARTSQADASPSNGETQGALVGARVVGADGDTLGRVGSVERGADGSVSRLRIDSAESGATGSGSTASERGGVTSATTDPAPGASEIPVPEDAPLKDRRAAAAASAALAERETGAPVPNPGGERPSTAATASEEPDADAADRSATGGEGEMTAARDAYLSGWRRSIDAWSDTVGNRADAMGEEAASDMAETWEAVETRWETLEQSSGESWARAKTAFEEAFEAFERSWAETASR